MVSFWWREVGWVLAQVAGRGLGLKTIPQPNGEGLCTARPMDHVRGGRSYSTQDPTGA